MPCQQAPIEHLDLRDQYVELFGHEHHHVTRNVGEHCAVRLLGTFDEIARTT